MLARRISRFLFLSITLALLLVAANPAVLSAIGSCGYYGVARAFNGGIFLGQGIFEGGFDMDNSTQCWDWFWQQAKPSAEWTMCYTYHPDATTISFNGGVGWNGQYMYYGTTVASCCQNHGFCGPGCYPWNYC